MKFIIKLILFVTLLLTISSKKSFHRKSHLLMNETPPADNTKKPTDDAKAPISDKANILIKTFKDTTLHANPERDNILNNAFLKYIFEVIGYTSDDSFIKCLEAATPQAKVNAISAFKKIWANKDQSKVQVPIILQNIQCPQIADLVTKIATAGLLDKLVNEIKQFIKTMKLFIRMFR